MGGREQRPDTGSHERRVAEVVPEFDRVPDGAALIALLLVCGVVLLSVGSVGLVWLLWGRA